MRTANIESDGHSWLGDSHSIGASQDMLLGEGSGGSGRSGSDNGGTDGSDGVGGKGLSFPAPGLAGVARMKDLKDCTGCSIPLSGDDHRMRCLTGDGRCTCLSFPIPLLSQAVVGSQNAVFATKYILEVY